MRSRLLTVSFAALLGLACPVAAQTITGRVVEAGTATPVPLVAVTVVGADQRVAGHTRTRDDGGFTLELRAPGDYRLRAERTGYAPVLTQQVQVGLRATLDVEIQISVQPMTIEPLTIRALREPPRRRSLEGSGFYQREAAGFGHFLRREDIEHQSQSNVAQLLDRQPGIQLFLDPRGRAYVTFGRAQGAAGAFARAQQRQVDVCLPRVYLDGNQVYIDSPGSTGPTLNDLVQPEQIEAIEMYASAAQMPPQYGGSNASCGVILIWTKKEP